MNRKLKCILRKRNNEPIDVLVGEGGEIGSRFLLDLDDSLRLIPVQEKDRLDVVLGTMSKQTINRYLQLNSDGDGERLNSIIFSKDPTTLRKAWSVLPEEYKVKLKGLNSTRYS